MTFKHLETSHCLVPFYLLLATDMTPKKSLCAPRCLPAPLSAWTTLVCLGVFMPSVLAIAQPVPVNIVSGTVDYHVCGNSKQGSPGDGNCGMAFSVGPDDGNYDNSPAALTGNVVNITGSASIDNQFSYQATNSVFGAYHHDMLGAGTADDNQVTIDTTGTLAGDVYGAYVYVGNSGLATNNRVIFREGTAQRVQGGFSYSNAGLSHAEGNRTEMSGGTVSQIAGAYVSSNTDNSLSLSVDNHLVLSGSATVSYSAHGGSANNNNGGASASKNTASISDTVNVAVNVFGGEATGGHGFITATENSAMISGSVQIGGDAYGGSAKGDYATAGGATAIEGNRLEISGSVRVTGDAYGGYAQATLSDSTASFNTLIVSSTGVTTVNSIFGGYAEGDLSTATKNSAVVSGAWVKGDAVGGYASSWGNSSAIAGGATLEEGNTLEILGGAIDGDVYGGVARGSNSKAEATNNRIRISGSVTINPAASVYGGYADGDTARTEKNEITLSSGTMDTLLYGGMAKGDVGDAQSITNKITLLGGTVKSIRAGSVQADYGLAEAHGNAVEISSSATVDDEIYGGYVEGMEARASANEVYFSGTVGNNGIVGGYASAKTPGYKAEVLDNKIWMSGGVSNGSLMGGYAESESEAIAKSNKLRLSNGLVTDWLVGGFASSIQDIATAGGAAGEGNHVEISGGEVQDSIYGGFANASTDAFATHNHITLSGTPTLDQAKLYGGFGYGGAGSDFYTGNTLNIKTRGLKVQSLQNFEYLNFDLPSTLVSGETLLSVSGTADLGNDSLIGLAVDGANLPLLQPGDYVVLIDATNGGNLAGSHRNTQASATAGSLQLDFDIDSLTSTNQLIARLQQIRLGSGSASLTDPALVGSATLARGADFIAQQGMQAVLAAQSAAGGAYQGAAPSGAQNGSAHSGTAQNGSAPSGAAQQSSRYHPRLFAAISGSQMEYQRSALEVDSQTLAVGAATGLPTHAGDLTLAAFIEHGEGRYHGKQHDATRAIKAQGETRYSGGGLIGRLDTGALYLEGSLRGGIAKTGYRSHDTTGRQVDYDQDSRNHYIGAHSSIGKLWNLGEKNRLDTYARALWNRQSKDEVKLSTGESLRFEAQDSRRIQLGARFNHVLGGSLNAFAGLAYEHEFTARGRARLETGGKAYKITPSGLKGGSTLLEAGLSGRPGPHSPLTLDLGIQTHTGKRKGLAAHLRVSYGF